MSVSDQASEHLMAARTFASRYCPKQPLSLWNGEPYRHSKIRVAYVSPDLREHPVGHLMAGIFEAHDKSRFETIAISLGSDDQSRLRARMLKSFDRFIDARDLGSEPIARLMRELEVDIAVDLGGYTSDTRTEIFAWRPAPVQVNFLGYPGTMGVDYFDYIVADRHVIPPAQQHHYAERVAYLAHSYLPTDAGLCISPRTPTRAECGLPDTGTVFCSFSHDYKISPPMFGAWMRILGRVPGSVLWLMSRSEATRENLRREAVSAGIDPARLVFAERVPRVEDHMARYRQADLFLDTHPYKRAHHRSRCLDGGPAGADVRRAVVPLAGGGQPAACDRHAGADHRVAGFLRIARRRFGRRPGAIGRHEGAHRHEPKHPCLVRHAALLSRSRSGLRDHGGPRRRGSADMTVIVVVPIYKPRPDALEVQSMDVSFAAHWPAAASSSSGRRGWTLASTPAATLASTSSPATRCISPPSPATTGCCSRPAFMRASRRTSSC